MVISITVCNTAAVDGTPGGSGIWSDPIDWGGDGVLVSDAFVPVGGLEVRYTRFIRKPLAPHRYEEMNAAVERRLLCL